MMNIKLFENFGSDLDRFMSIWNKHYSPEDIEKLEGYNPGDYVASQLKEVFEEMKRRLGDYSEYIHEGNLEGLEYDLTEGLNNTIRLNIDNKICYFRISNNVLSAEDEYSVMKQLYGRFDDDEEFIKTLNWKSGQDMLTREDEEKIRNWYR